jgi:hypothetical protein
MKKVIMTFEKYTTYSELSKGKWGTPEEMMADAEFIIGRVLPTNDKKWIKDIEDQSTDQGIKFQATLSGGDVIHMYMVSKWRMNMDSWEFYLNKKKIKSFELIKALEEKYMSDLEKFLKYAFSYDFYAQYIDNGTQYKNAVANNDRIEANFKELSPKDKKSAIEALEAKFGKELSSKVFK